ncbi:MAG: 4-hydroxy-tetrahydrodipicolinate synthase [Acidimicrobiia bacterium]|nr:4-hydroxy-tetrahydrodipicolinate synthase [Acidimicrobiia bacterium]NNC92367.1 4-hydroxy-tetrahydrodipicolinate synthase [Acidimicrobiia bacterium]
MMAPFGEVLTAMITPFDESGEVDYDKIWRLARYLVDNGSDGLVITGTTGESPVLSANEKVAVYRAVVEAVGERAKIVAGTGTYNTAESVDLSKRAAEAGVDAVMAVTPYYSKPDQEGLVRHFSMIADATELPLLLYNIPGRSARLIEVGTLARLSAHPNIVAVKDAVMDIDHTAQSRMALPDDFAIYSGQDSYTLAMMVVGASGVVSVASHLVGKQIKRMVRAATEGDWAEAQRLNFGLLDVFYACFVEPSPMPVKAALGRLWESVGEPRPPLVPAASATVDAIEIALGKAQSL